MIRSLAIVETHPVQYHAPVYRSLAQEFGVDATVIYGSDFSVAGYRDTEFGVAFAWDTDLLGGVRNHFVSELKEGGATSVEQLTAAGLPAALNAVAPDVVLGLGYSHPYDRVALKWALKHGRPLLFRGDTTDKDHRRGLLKTIIRDLLLRGLYRRCAALLYVGQNSRAHYERLGVPTHKLISSPHCVNEASFSPTRGDRDLMRGPARQRLGIAEDKVVILYSGKLSARKGVDLLPGAVRLLPPALQKRAHLLFIGDGALRESLANDCQSLPRVAATFAGFQNQSALSSFYHAADLLVLPSRTMETWGLVVNEALLHGLPCVVSRGVGSQPDLVIPGKTGAVSQDDTPAALAQALAEVMPWAGSEGTATACRSQVSGYTTRAAAEGIAKAMEMLGQEA